MARKKRGKIEDVFDDVANGNEETPDSSATEDTAEYSTDVESEAHVTAEKPQHDKVPGKYRKFL